MNNQNRGLTTQGMTIPHTVLILLAALIIGVSGYLTKHYFNVHFSNDLSTAGLCNLSAFWSCDITTTSAFGAILNIPTSVFGIVMGICIILGSIFPSEEFEQTNSMISKINFVACGLLFFYSLIALGGLCPMCTAYYVLSSIVTFLYWKYGHQGFAVDLPSLGTCAGVMIVFGALFSYQVTTKKNITAEQKEKIKADLIPRFFALEDKGEPKERYGYYIMKSTENYADAPIRITAFSDFQCPYCARMNTYLHDFKQKYAGKMNIDYMFYPLDANCNPEMKGNMHPYACKAAYLAACTKDDFFKVHDDIFDNQQGLNDEWIDNYAKKKGVSDCIKDPKTKELVVEMIKEGKRFGVKSTPTMLINNRRIDGLLRPDQFYIIFDEIIRRAGK